MDGNRHGARGRGESLRVRLTPKPHKGGPTFGLAVNNSIRFHQEGAVSVK